MSDRGRYVVIDGPDGSGKSAQRDMLVRRYVCQGVDAIGVHEPGETAIGEELERIIKDRKLGRSAITNLLLFTANRVELYAQIIEPALAAGKLVVADRNWLSTAAYQGVAEGLGVETVRDVTAQFLPPEYMNPDLTILLAAHGSVLQDRLDGRGGAEADTFESRGRDFQDKLLSGYAIAATLATNVVSIDANGTSDDVHEQIWQEAQRLI